MWFAKLAHLAKRVRMKCRWNEISKWIASIVFECPLSYRFILRVKLGWCTYNKVQNEKSKLKDTRSIILTIRRDQRVKSTCNKTSGYLAKRVTASWLITTTIVQVGISAVGVFSNSCRVVATRPLGKPLFDRRLQRQYKFSRFQIISRHHTDTYDIFNFQFFNLFAHKFQN